MMEISEVEVGLSVASSLKSRRLDPFCPEEKKQQQALISTKTHCLFALLIEKSAQQKITPA